MKGGHALAEEGVELRCRTLVVVNFERDETQRQFGALLDKPADIPQVAVFDAAFAEGEGDHFVGQDFPPALRLIKLIELTFPNKSAKQAL